MGQEKEEQLKNIHGVITQGMCGLSIKWKNVSAGRRILPRKCRVGPTTHEDNTIKIMCISVKEPLHEETLSPADETGQQSGSKITTTIQLHSNIKQPASDTTDRTLEFNIVFNDTPVQNIHAAIGMLKDNKAGLDRVKYLNISIFAIAEKTYDSDDEMLADVAKLRGYADQLKDLVPNVRYIKCTDSVRQGFSIIFQYHVLNSFSPRLYQLQCQTSYFSQLDSFSKKLLSLKLDHNGMYDGCKPHMRTERLKYLTLSSLRADFDWKVFENEKRPGHIDFRRVEHMRLDTDSWFELSTNPKRFLYEGEDGSFPYKINAPNLKYLQIKPSPLLFSILRNAKLPKTLQMLVIKEKNGLTFSLHKVCTKALVNDVFAKYTELDDKRMEYNDFIASLFGNNNISKRVECVVNRELTLADFKDMSSPLYVTSLTVMLSISFADLLALVSRMPELKKMAALKVAFPANAQGTISVPKLKKELDKYSASLLPKLVTMRLEVSDSQHSKEEALDCLVDFMLKNAKALRRLEFG